MKVVLKMGKKLVAFVISFLIFTLMFSILTHKEVFATSSINTSQTYYVYDGITGEFLRQYTLDAVPYVDNSRSVIGADTRTVDFSVSGVVKLMSQTGYLGSGFVVDEHTIGTAAHCVYNRSTNSISMVESIRLFDANGDVKMNAYPVEVHIPKNYITSSSNTDYDYALISVRKDVSKYACFNLGTVLNSMNTSTTPIFVSGFPKRVGNTYVNLTNNIEYTGTGHLFFLENRTIFYDVDTSGGDSGGPIYMQTEMNDETYYTLIGIHTNGDDNNIHSGYNYGTRITTELLHFYKSNSNVSYER